MPPAALSVYIEFPYWIKNDLGKHNVSVKTSVRISLYFVCMCMQTYTCSRVCHVIQMGYKSALTWGLIAPSAAVPLF